MQSNSSLQVAATVAPLHPVASTFVTEDRYVSAENRIEAVPFANLRFAVHTH